MSFFILLELTALQSASCRSSSSRQSQNIRGSPLSPENHGGRKLSTSTSLSFWVFGQFESYSAHHTA
jgi:hypothetical protein